jgi:hypothetical protein
MRHVPLVAGDEIVDADNLVAFGEKAIAQVRSEKPGRAGDDDSHPSVRPIER